MGFIGPRAKTVCTFNWSPTKENFTFNIVDLSLFQLEMPYRTSLYQQLRFFDLAMGRLQKLKTLSD